MCANTSLLVTLVSKQREAEFEESVAMSTCTNSTTPHGESMGGDGLSMGTHPSALVGNEGGQGRRTHGRHFCQPRDGADECQGFGVSLLKFVVMGGFKSKVLYCMAESAL